MGTRVSGTCLDSCLWIIMDGLVGWCVILRRERCATDRAGQSFEDLSLGIHMLVL